MYAKPLFSQNIYTNKDDGSLLRLIQEFKLFNMIVAHVLALCQYVKNQGQYIKGQGEGQKILSKKVMTLNSLNKTSISIQKPIFTTYCWRRIIKKQEDNKEAIKIRNIQPYARNVYLDVHLFQKNLIQLS